MTIKLSEPCRSRSRESRPHSKRYRAITNGFVALGLADLRRLIREMRIQSLTLFVRPREQLAPGSLG